MIAQGTDGLSRGDKSAGTMAGEGMLKFVPLNETAFERSAPMKSWFEGVAQKLGAVVLDTEGWFDGITDPKGTYIWNPPPAAADVAVEQFSYAKHKRPMCMHILVLPRLMTGRWRKLLIRRTDLYFPLDNAVLWPVDTQFEPVFVFISLPCILHRPKFEERASLLAQIRGVVFSDRMQKIHTDGVRNHMCKLLGSARKLSSL